MIDQRALDIAVRKFPMILRAARTRTEQITAWKLRHLIRAPEYHRVVRELAR